MTTAQKHWILACDSFVDFWGDAATQSYEVECVEKVLLEDDEHPGNDIMDAVDQILKNGGVRRFELPPSSVIREVILQAAVYAAVTDAAPYTIVCVNEWRDAHQTRQDLQASFDVYDVPCRNGNRGALYVREQILEVCPLRELERVAGRHGAPPAFVLSLDVDLDQTLITASPSTHAYLTNRLRSGGSKQMPRALFHFLPRASR